MATSDGRKNRSNGNRGYEASRRSRHVSRFLNQIIVGRVNGRDAVLAGISCKQLGKDVVVAVGFYPYEEDEKRAAKEAAELAKALREQGYTVSVVEDAPQRMWVTAHPGWL